MADKAFNILDPGRVGLGRGFKFEAGHVLPGYDGKCAEPHGHSYHGRVMVSVARTYVDAVGIVLDFDVLKQAIHHCIFVPYDHKTLDTTAEILVHTMLADLQTWFATYGGSTLNVPHENVGLKTRNVPLGVRVEEVVLYETALCYAVARNGGF